MFSITSSPLRCLIMKLWLYYFQVSSLSSCHHCGKRECPQNEYEGISLVVHWLRLRASTVGGTGSIPGRGTKIPKAEWCSQKKKDTPFLDTVRIT